MAGFPTRRKVRNKGRSAKKFKKTLDRVKQINVTTPMRGGIRL